MYFPQALQAYKTYKADCANMNATAATTKLATHFGLNLYQKSDSLKFQQQIPKAKMERECSGFIFHAIVEGAGVAHDTALFRHDTGSYRFFDPNIGEYQIESSKRIDFTRKYCALYEGINSKLGSCTFWNVKVMA
jgi:hypothetical protein